MRRSKRLVISSATIVHRRNISAPAMTTWKVCPLAAILVWICYMSRIRYNTLNSEQVPHLVPKDNNVAVAHHASVGITLSPSHANEERPPLQPIENRTIMLIHVGKAGGSTLLKSFHKRYWQEGNVLQRTDVLLPICHMHACTPKIMDRATTWLFVVRNPVERLISAYKFSHPDNCMTYDPTRGMNVTNDIWGCRLPRDAREFYKVCARTLEELATVPFDDDNSQSISLGGCRELIRAMVGGTELTYKSLSTHAFYNYAHYTNVTLDRVESLGPDEHGATKQKPKEIFVVRTEHLWQDASALDVLLNGTGKFNTDQIVTHGSENYHTHTSALSNLGYERMCCMLRKEIHAFESIVRWADNLMNWEKDEAIQHVKRSCGFFRICSESDLN